MTNEAFLKRVDRFLLDITPQDKICIIHDTDPDGVCSAVIMAKCIERLRGRKIDLRIPLDKKQYGLTKDMLKKIKQHKITKLITTDFSAEHNLPALKEIEKQADILVIDHHKLYADYQSQKTILCKPQYFTTIEPSTYCTGKLAYDAANRVTDVNDLDWIAAAACIADIATAPWKDWLAKVFKKYKIKQNKNPFQTEIGQVAATISSTEVYNSKLVPKCFDIFYRAKKPKDILNSPFGKYKKIIDKELDKHLKLFEKKAEKREEMLIYELTSKYRVHSPLSTILGLKYPHKTIIIINKTSPQISVSARRGDKKTAVNNLLEKAVKGIPNSNAGGHAPAAGAGFPKKYLKTFKQRLT
ncbi:MAG: DHH family phosphoesterase [Candidatus Woesearchaeota archaeon]